MQRVSYLQRIAYELFDIIIYDDLAELIFEFLPSIYYEIFKNKIINEIDSEEIDFHERMQDIRSMAELNIVPIEGERIYITIPIKFIMFDWTTYFSYISHKSMLDRNAFVKYCKCNKIPKNIYIKRYVIDIDDDGIIICYKCSCEFINSIPIRIESLDYNELNICLEIEYIIEKGMELMIL